MAEERLTIAKVVRAIEAENGYITRAAKRLGVDAQTIYNYRDRYPAVALAIEESREQRHDLVENALMNRIGEGDTTAIIFYLKCQAKGRGYVERQEITGRDGGPIETTVRRDLSRLDVDELRAMRELIEKIDHENP